MKKNLEKKLVLKKITVASLAAEQLKALRGGNLQCETFNQECDGGPGGNSGFFCTSPILCGGLVH